MATSASKESAVFNAWKVNVMEELVATIPDVVNCANEVDVATGNHR